MSATRLDRLVTLLETGSTALIRNTAADQLADVQKQHPDELFNLLTRVIPYLRTKSWETRVAAAKAVGGIVSNAEKFDPNAEDEPVKPEELLQQSPSNGHVKSEAAHGFPVKKEEDADTDADADNSISPAEDQLDLNTLDLSYILKFGRPLLASAGREYDFKLASLAPADRLAHLKKSLKARLGLCGKYMEDDLLAEEDMASQNPGTRTPGLLHLDTTMSRANSIHSATSPPPGATASAEQPPALSKRQLNAMKRKAKKEVHNRANKVQIVDLGPRRQNSLADYPPTPASALPQSIKQESKEDNGSDAEGMGDYFSLDRKGGDDDSKMVKEFKGAPIPDKTEFLTEAEESGLEWPFERVCEVLTLDLFDHAWEIRHGAAMGLREVIRVHGAGAGRQKGKTRSQNDALNQTWLNDLACRICCVFMLDRFADYTSDNAVAPIRETAGQTLGSVLQHLSPDNVIAAFKVLHRLVMQKDSENTSVWQVCQGGMIGLRYLVAVRSDLLLQEATLMDGVLAAVIKGLGDFDDDVRAISAATLIPVTREFVEMRPNALQDLINQVWSCLSNLQDDLSASTGFIMDLLAKLCSFPQVLSAMQANAQHDPSQSFHELVPRLFPFLRHTITSVRAAVLRALITFLDIQGSDTDTWIDSKALQLIFQNLLLERNETVLRLSLQLWNAVIDSLVTGGNDLSSYLAPILDAMIPLTLTPIGVPRNPISMDPSLLIRPSGQPFGPPLNDQPNRPTFPGASGEPSIKRRKKSRVSKEDMAAPSTMSTTHNVDGHMVSGDLELIGADTMIRSRIAASRALGKAMAAWPETSRQETFESRILSSLHSTNSTTQLTTALIIEEFGKSLPVKDGLAETFAKALLPVVEGPRPPAYEDLVPKLQLVLSRCDALFSIFENHHVSHSQVPRVVQGHPLAGGAAFSTAFAETILKESYDKLKKQMTPAARMVATPQLEAAKAELEEALQEAKDIKEERDTRIKATAASALVALQLPPQKPSLTIKAIMDSVKKEENVELQKRSAVAVAGLVTHLVNANKTNIFKKIVGNLVKYYCMETAETPEFLGQANIETGILTLKKDEDVRDHPDAAKFAEDAKAARITKRGARGALEQIAENFGAQVLEKVPSLRNLIENPIRRAFTEDTLPPEIMDEDGVFGQEVVDSLSTLRALVGKLHPDVRGFVKDLLPLIGKALQSRLYVLRYAAAKCFATVCSVMPVEGITMLVQHVLPTISNPSNVHWRQGAIECIYHLIHVMEDSILPYVIFLITPVLGRMSDSDNDVRLLATTSFATLVKLVPLESGIPDPPGLPEALLRGREKERKFVAQMLDPKKVEQFDIPVGIKATLRSYQQDGVNWLAFLNRYNLHGILCDDMGLGKTLQTLCMVASDHHLRAEEFAKSQDPNCRPMPTLIVCPPTLSGHWQQEIRQYAPFLKSVAYVGSPPIRSQLRSQLEDSDIVITSYDICRNDNDVLKPLAWNYCVLDEGHLIKNAKSKTSISVKNFQSNHRLILSGTPIQNNVLELWSLFDFLMPGFLGTEKVFLERFAKPIAASRFAKSSSKEQEKGALAIEALHKQVLPFLLRRLKEEVLDDLPPKILQNYYCDLSPLQRKLFEDFQKKEGREIQSKAGAADKESKQHIFQALQYMKKLCNSPALIIKPTHKHYEATQKYLKQENSSIEDIEHAPKLGALKDLLVDCGIGASDVEKDKSTEDTGDLPEAVSQHRALVFCQMKEMLDMVQHNVLEKLLPSVQFMRLDGSVEANKRQDIVNKFNSDPSYDVLLLTTAVGGLGLNLTGADTVIFVEHDWNPQKDIQAMDRAHRIGQKKVVNVYRIVTRGTLEEKILNLQRFKIDVASTVVNQQNAGLGSMQTDQILDLFNVSADSADPSALPPPPLDKDGGIDENDAVDATGNVREKGQKGFLDELGELWDERQYEEEFDLEGFLGKMKG